MQRLTRIAILPGTLLPVATGAFAQYWRMAPNGGNVWQPPPYQFQRDLLLRRCHHDGRLANADYRNVRGGR